MEGPPGFNAGIYSLEWWLLGLGMGAARPEGELPVTLHVPACTPDTVLPTARLQGSWLRLALTSMCRPGVWDLGWDSGQWSLPIGPA